MNTTIKSKGACLCGAVTLHAESMETKVGACHCNMCRKWAGGPFISVACKDTIKIIGEEAVSIFASSDIADRGFCAQCGTHLFYRLKQSNQYFVPVGLFDTASKLHFDHQIFIDEKPEYYSFVNETKNMTGAEALATFSSE